MPLEGPAPRLLLIEDEEGVIDPVVRGLREEGYHVDVAREGPYGLRQALTEEYMILIIDWRLPGMDGRTVVERLRGAQVRTPILMLTALRDVGYRVAGLDAGADDYLTKPFVFDELLARLRALRRRAAETSDVPPGHHQVYLQTGPLTMDTARRTAHLAGRPLDLRTKEYRLLELLLRLRGEVATRTSIAESVWGSAFDVTDNAIDVTVSNLRQSLSEAAGDGPCPIGIETVRGVGYRLPVPAEHSSLLGGS